MNNKYSVACITLVRDKYKINNRVTNCPGMPGTVPESRVCVPRPGQEQSGTIKCPGIGSSEHSSDNGKRNPSFSSRRHEVNA